MPQPFLALVTALVGVVSMSAPVVAQTGSELGPWVSGGGAAAAVGALVYMAKLLADGKLVAINTAERERYDQDALKQMGELVKKGMSREDVLAELVEDCKEREDVFRSFLVGRGKA